MPAGHPRPPRESVEIGILTVIPPELQAARSALGSLEEDENGGLSGTIYLRGVVPSVKRGRDYSLVLAGIGAAGNPGAAALAAQMIERYRPRVVLLSLLGLALIQICAGPVEFPRSALGATDGLEAGPVAMCPRVPRPRLKPPAPKQSSSAKPQEAANSDGTKAAPQKEKPSEKPPCAQPHCVPKRPDPGAGGNGVASEFGSLRGMSRADADAFLRSQGAEVKVTQGGYTHYRFQDKSEVVIRPDGEVIRLPKPLYGPDGARVNKGARLDEKGMPTQIHNTGERVVD